MKQAAACVVDAISRSNPISTSGLAQLSICLASKLHFGAKPIKTHTTTHRERLMLNEEASNVKLKHVKILESRMKSDSVLFARFPTKDRYLLD